MMMKWWMNRHFHETSMFYQLNKIKWFHFSKEWKNEMEKEKEKRIYGHRMSINRTRAFSICWITFITSWTFFTFIHCFITPCSIWTFFTNHLYWIGWIFFQYKPIPAFTASFVLCFKHFATINHFTFLFLVDEETKCDFIAFRFISIIIIAFFLFVCF